jgi:hypothetical protein
MGEWDTRPDPPCVACGKRHKGAVSAELQCLRGAVVKLRGEVAGARHVADSILRALAPGR